MTRWILCKNKMPELDKSVLACTDDQDIFIMTLTRDERSGWLEWRTDEEYMDFALDKVVAWMPLPEPYKADKGEQE